MFYCKETPMSVRYIMANRGCNRDCARYSRQTVRRALIQEIKRVTLRNDSERRPSLLCVQPAYDYSCTSNARKAITTTKRRRPTSQCSKYVYGIFEQITVRDILTARLKSQVLQITTSHVNLRDGRLADYQAQRSNMRFNCIKITE